MSRASESGGAIHCSTHQERIGRRCIAKRRTVPATLKGWSLTSEGVDPDWAFPTGIVVPASLFLGAAETGRHQVPKIYSMAARNLGARGFPLFWHVLLPASLPYIVSGLKQGWAFAWRSLISGEMIFVSLGLGQLLMMGRDLNDMNQVIAVMIVIIAIGAVVDRLVFKTIERRLQLRWGLTPAT
jgi:ABC-type nitrate/sulfonate/bicarbonate transport system permease component